MIVLVVAATKITETEPSIIEFVKPTMSPRLYSGNCSIARSVMPTTLRAMSSSKCHGIQSSGIGRSHRNFALPMFHKMNRFDVPYRTSNVSLKTNGEKCWQLCCSCLEIRIHADAQPADGAAIVCVPEAIVFDGHAVDLDGVGDAEDVVASAVFDALAAYDAE